jgi:hypothetical protein
MIEEIISGFFGFRFIHEAVQKIQNIDLLIIISLRFVEFLLQGVRQFIARDLHQKSWNYEIEGSLAQLNINNERSLLWLADQEVKPALPNPAKGGICRNAMRKGAL